MTPKLSKAQIRRMHAAETERQNTIPNLSAEVEDVVDRYRPDDMVGFDLIMPVWREVMCRSGLGLSAITKVRSVAWGYMAWVHVNGFPLEIHHVMRWTSIDGYVAQLDVSDRTRTDYRSRLRSLAKAVSPSLDAPPSVPYARRHVRGGYSDEELAKIRRLALDQRYPKVRAKLCVLVGLCGGAGAGTIDLRHVHRRHIIDNGPHRAIIVCFEGPRPRQVAVRREFEELIRIGIAGLEPDDWVLGENPNRKNITTTLLTCVENFDMNMPDISADRLRATWLIWLMGRRIPVQVIMQASGLTEAKSLNDLAKTMAPVAIDTIEADLRGDHQ
jgi:hypothetical protein